MSKVTLFIDGKEITAEKGTSVLKAALDNGIYIPHFCWHPGFKEAGNCRMCLVRIGKGPKPMSSCTVPVADGMEVISNAPDLDKARAAVMEFLLINHPLDCPVCDKAGECYLQDYSYYFGWDRSRFCEAKNEHPPEYLGSDITIWHTRCIICTRCERFLDEVSGTGELAVRQRSDSNIITLSHEKMIDTELAGNLADICPVGALIDKNTMYKARVWNLKSTKSICSLCSRGCPINIETQDNKIIRIKPQHYLTVHGNYFICNHGRYDFQYIQDNARLRLNPKYNPVQVVGDFLDKDTQFVVSTYATCEEMYILKELSATIGAPPPLVWAPEIGSGKKFKNFEIYGDPSPNRAGALQILGKAGSSHTELAGKERAFIFASWPNIPDDDWIRTIKGVPRRIVFDLFDSAIIEGAAYAFPSVTHAEQDGTYINADGIARSFRRALPEYPIRPIPLVVLQQVLQKFNSSWKVLSTKAIADRIGLNIERPKKNIEPWLNPEFKPVHRSEAKAPAEPERKSS